jgi:ATP-binding cassette subfamily B protein
MSNFAQENFAGIRVVKSFAQEENQTKEFDEINRKYVKQNLSIVKLDAVLNQTLGLASALGIIIVIFIGGLETINGKISIGTFVAFPFYLGRLTWPMAALGWTISIFQRAFASMERLQELLNTKPEITPPDKDKVLYLSEIKGEIEFKNVSLHYQQPPHSALEDINLQIHPGTTVAIMGPIGSGKSSLVNLIPRLFDPTKGEITIDGINIKNLSLTELRDVIGFVPQDVFLFSDSIKENINYGLTASEEVLVTKSAEIARAHDDIEGFTDKYDTMLGERGINLSGGQKQRITIARAIIKNPKILILDDCLSSVDVETEESILRHLKEVLRNRTTIIVSHRLPAVKLADVIVFMENGRIAEYGKHSELLLHKGRYANFYHRQKLISDLERT